MQSICPIQASGPPVFFVHPPGFDIRRNYPVPSLSLALLKPTSRTAMAAKSFPSPVAEI
ncbi:hypothetical protein Hanom_Chr09g00829051 [Helianthus anomalus]